MDTSTQSFICDIIDHGRDMTLATVRDDGYPQATTVTFAHDGLTLYTAVGKDSQKVHNIRRCPKVSLTINNAYGDWSEIKGISMAAHAEVLDDPAAIADAQARIRQRFPQIAAMADDPAMRAQMALLRIEPEVISVLDYTKGFGHTELVTVH